MAVVWCVVLLVLVVVVGRRFGGGRFVAGAARVAALAAGVAAPCCDAQNASLTLRVDPPSSPVQLSGELNSCLGTARQGGVRTKRLSCTIATR